MTDTNTLPAGSQGVLWRFISRFLCIAILFFLLLPLLVVIPISFSSDPYLTFSRAMLTLQPSAFSDKWYATFFTDPEWLSALRNSFIIAPSAALIATVLGTLAALGLSRPHAPFRRFFMAIMILPMIVPLVITGTALLFFFAPLHMNATYGGMILAHAILGVPFVVITVTATLQGFDERLIRAGKSLGGSSFYVLRRIILPLIAPGVVSGGLFAFMISFDEIVVGLFLAGPDQQTIPLKMWINLRYTIDPTILAVATLIIAFAVAILFALEILRRRSVRIRGT